MLTMNPGRGTVTVQATMEVDARLYNDARTWRGLSTTGRLAMQLLNPTRYERLVYASRMVPSHLLDSPQVVTQREAPRYGFLERRARGL